MKFRFITLLCVFALCSNVYAERNSEEQNRLLKVNNEAIKDSKHINLDQKHVEESDFNANNCLESDHFKKNEDCHKLEKSSKHNFKGQLANEVGEQSVEEIKPMESTEEDKKIKNDQTKDIIDAPTGDIPTLNVPVNQQQNPKDHETNINIASINQQQDQKDAVINNIPPINQQHNQKDIEKDETPVNPEHEPKNTNNDDLNSIAPVSVDDFKNSLPIGTTTTDSDNAMFLNSNENNLIEEGNGGKIVAGVALTGAVLSVGAVLDFVKKNNPEIYSDIKRNISKRSNSIKNKAVTVTRKLTRKSSHPKTTSIKNSKNHYRHDLAEALIV